ncbi:hypothetical protein H8356DRAFT_1362569 [Neocallimastix lanati (nom. inval.)]|nr:hypothetical protein H8356DRAFT_1362569 [Neocallimastix sp. JGI-2020a]
MFKRLKPLVHCGNSKLNLVNFLLRKIFLNMNSYYIHLGKSTVDDNKYENFILQYIYEFLLDGISALNELQFHIRKQKTLKQFTGGLTSYLAKAIPIIIRNPSIPSGVDVVLISIRNNTINTNTNSPGPITVSLESNYHN